MLLDLDDTLLEDGTVIADVLGEVCGRASARLGVDPVALERAARTRARELWRGAPTGPLVERLGISSWEGLSAAFDGGHDCVAPLRAWAPAYRRATWAAALVDVGVACAEADRVVDDVADDYRRTRWDTHRLLPDALAVLGALRDAGHRLGLVTNGPPDLQRRKVEATGIDGWFGTIVISGAAGAGKPDPAVLHRALAALGGEPSDAVMVGDNPRTDVAAAVAAGVAAVHLADPPAADPPGGAAASVRLADVPATVARLLGR